MKRTRQSRSPRLTWRWLGLLVGCVAFQSVPPAFAWENDAWGARVKITFDNSGQAQNLDNFPVLIKLDSSRIQYFRTQDAGQDIRFVDDDDATVLDHEIELWDESGTSYVWVRVPRINALSSADFIYMYYDNVNAADGQNPTGVWDVNYRGVWHLKEAGSPYAESTANPNDGTSTSAPTRTTGRIGYGQDFDGASNFINVGNDGSLNLIGALTLEAWVQLQVPRAPNWGADIVGKEDQYRLYHDFDADYRMTLTVDTPTRPYPSDDPLPPNTWLYVVGVYDGTNNAMIYVNGSWAATVPNTGTPITPVATSVEIGRSLSGTIEFDGLIDEVRISSLDRSADWIAAQHLSMTDTFATFAAPEAGPCCQSLTTSDDVALGEITVTSPASFEMLFRRSQGSALDRFWDLAEDPTRTYNLAGKDASDFPPGFTSPVKTTRGRSWICSRRLRRVSGCARRCSSSSVLRPAPGSWVASRGSRTTASIPRPSWACAGTVGSRPTSATPGIPWRSGCGTRGATAAAA
jgi:hypothetical protein